MNDCGNVPACKLDTQSRAWPAITGHHAAAAATSTDLHVHGACAAMPCVPCRRCKPQMPGRQMKSPSGLPSLLPQYQYTGRSAGRLGARPSLAKGSCGCCCCAAAAAAAASRCCCRTMSTNRRCHLQRAAGRGGSWWARAPSRWAGGHTAQHTQQGKVYPTQCPNRSGENPTKCPRAPPTWHRW